MRKGKTENKGKEKENENKNDNGTDQSLFDALLPAFNDAFVKATPEELELGLPLAGAHRDLKTGSFHDADIAKLLRRGYNQVASELG